jgi:hypothetical protein
MKICIIGNAASGKTRLSRALSKRYGWPITHIDSLQFDQDLKVRPHQKTLEALDQIQKTSDWILDGYGPLDDLQKRFSRADLVIVLDLPLWCNYWWGTLRFFRIIWHPREELPAGHNELQWAHIKKFYQGLKKVHQLMRPELLRILSRPEFHSKCLTIKNQRDYRKLLRTGLPPSIVVPGSEKC